MPDKHEDTGRFGGPGSSHRDREHPGKNCQSMGHEKGGEQAGPAPDEPTNTRSSGVSGGGGQRDLHHTHTENRS